MKILVINSGSSSLKFQLFDMSTETVLAKGICDRIGFDGGIFKYSAPHISEIKENYEMQNHTQACKKVINALTVGSSAVISDVGEIAAIGHRIVHGGDYFTESVIVDDSVIDKIEACSFLAPLHAHPNASGVRACGEIINNIPQVVVFDTAFHQTMPEHAYMYALPFEYYEKYKIRRYGFHGTSHKYVAEKAAEYLGKKLEDTKIVTLHLGNGSSLCAVKNGKCIDTSMGLTPLEGPMMGTRCGSVDPAIVALLMEKENLSSNEINEIMNKKSGLLAISGISNDFRDIGDASEKGNHRANLAIDMYSYHVKKILSSYVAALNGGVDAVVFTAGVGENRADVRSKVTSGLEFMGIKIDNEKNDNIKGKICDISAQNSAVKTLVISTNEELMIARETQNLITK